MVRKLIFAGALLALAAGAAGSASAQVMMSPFKTPEKRALTQEEIDKKKAADAAYKAAMDKIPDKKGAADPWGNVRDAPATATTAAKTTTTAKTATKTKPQQ